MKHFLLFLAFAFICEQSIGQTTLTAANNMYQTGESFLVHGLTVSGISQGSPGSGQTWDFSGFQSQVTGQVDMVAPSTTVFADSFTTATVALHSGNTDDYYVFDNGAFSRKGVYNGGFVTNYSDPEDLFRYPMSYNSMFTDSFSGSYTSGITIPRIGEISVHVDGEGTLVTEQGTYSNVLRVKVLETYVDDISGFLITLTGEHYNWYRPGTHYPLFVYSRVWQDGSLILEVANYLDQTNVDRAESNTEFARNIQLYPNPATSNTNLRFLTKESGKIKIDLLDVMGRKVNGWMLNGNQTGSTSLRIELSQLVKGIYSLRIEQNGNISVKKLQVN